MLPPAGGFFLGPNLLAPAPLLRCESPMHYEEVPFDSKEYRAACTLRDRVMRQPIGMRLSEEDTAGEDTQFHFVARDDTGAVLATVIFKPVAEHCIKLRQMAVAPELHGKGVGRELVAFAEREAKNKGFRLVETNARITAQGFYEKMGYTPQGSLFIEVGLDTIRMTKEL